MTDFMDNVFVPLDKVKRALHPCGWMSYVEMADAMPMLKSTYFEAEKYFDSRFITEFTAAHWEIPVIFLTLYIAMIYFGPKYMKDREAWNLRGSLAAWNLFLSLFSFAGMIRTVPALLYNLYSYDFADTICNAPAGMYGLGSQGLWTALFIYSKIPELVDTFFIVFRKKRLIFLHWYHHVTVLLYCWLAYGSKASTGLYFVAMNYTVHAVMYGYYFLAATKQVPKWFPVHAITLAQISQMFVGIGICVSSYLYKQTRDCAVTDACMFWGGLMYASYAYLFVHFAVRRFVFKKEDFKQKKL